MALGVEALTEHLVVADRLGPGRNEPVAKRGELRQGDQGATRCVQRKLPGKRAAAGIEDAAQNVLLSSGVVVVEPDERDFTVRQFDGRWELIRVVARTAVADAECRLCVARTIVETRVNIVRAGGSVVGGPA